MDYKSIFEQFKKEYVKAEEVFSFGLFPILFEQLKNYGLDKEMITKEFISTLNEVLLPNEKTAVLLISLEYIEHYSNLMIPAAKAVAVEPTPAKEVPKVEVKQSVPQKGIPIEYNDYIPSEQEEGDPLYTPVDQRIDLNPEDCASMQTDWDFLKRINAIGGK